MVFRFPRCLRISLCFIWATVLFGTGQEVTIVMTQRGKKLPFNCLIAPCRNRAIALKVAL